MFEIRNVRIMSDGGGFSGCGPVTPGMYVEAEIEGECGLRYVLGERTVFDNVLRVRDTPSIEFVTAYMRDEICDEEEIILFNENDIEKYCFENVEDYDVSDSKYCNVFDIVMKILDETFGEIGEEQLPDAESKANKRWRGKKLI